MAIGLSKGQLSNTVGSIFTATAPSLIKTIILFNSNTANELIQLYCVNNNSGNLGTATSSDLFFSKNLTPGETYEISFAYPLQINSINDSIQGNSTTLNKINYICLGALIQN